MTPRMSAADVVFARKTVVLADGLRNIWPWGTRGTLLEDERDFQYESCYPNMEQAGVVAEMKARRSERNTLDAMRELVLYLRDMREERKAIITVSEGWLLFRPNAGLTILRKDPFTGKTEPIPGPDPISVGPDGRITTKPRNAYGNVSHRASATPSASISHRSTTRPISETSWEMPTARTRRFTPSIRAACRSSTHHWGPPLQCPSLSMPRCFERASIRFGRSRKAPMA